MKLFVFLLLIPPIVLGVHIWRLKISILARTLLTLLMLAVTLTYPLDTLIFGSLAGPEMPSTLLLSQTWAFAGAVFLVALLLAYDLARGLWALGRLILGRKGRQCADIPADMSRRRFLQGGLAKAGMTLGAPAFCLASSGAGIANGTKAPRVQRMEAFFPGLPEGLDGFVLTMAADVHVGTLTSKAWVAELVQEINASRPDVVCLSGDLADGLPEFHVPDGATRAETAALFANIRARHGVFACTGNHEYISAYAEWMQVHAQNGVRFLHDEGTVLSHNGASLVLCGRDDMRCAVLGKFSAPASVVAAPFAANKGAFRVVLDHRPGRAAENAAAGFDLQLSGHTHGGQCLGMDALVARANAGLVRGWYAQGAMRLYVTNGAGLWPGFPVRLGVPAEIAVITLRKGEPSAA